MPVLYLNVYNISSGSEGVEGIFDLAIFDL